MAAAAAAASRLVGPKSASAADPSPPEETDTAVGVLIDLTRCTGCNSCALACKVANDKAQRATPPDGFSSESYSYVDEQVTADGKTHFVKRQCMHCLHPACVSACTVGALRKTPEGPVVYDAGKCIGCRYCQYACPFGVPTYAWDDPFGLIHKCQLCRQRLAVGEVPACVAACPNGALRFGERRALLSQARAQIDSNPGRYVPTIYGEHEASGTSILYLSSVPFTELGFPALGTQPVPLYAEAIMQQTPLIALSVASLATMMHLLFRRRNHLAEFSTNEEAGGAAQQDDQRAGDEQ
ncbi:MAG: 4Fe-4S dicluster domain-containing protein [Caldilineaceae bacterium]|nr:4Fe-4S dicluster domain-containing protein [Caldilineaceae bacterium]